MWVIACGVPGNMISRTIDPAELTLNSVTWVCPSGPGFSQVPSSALTVSSSAWRFCGSWEPECIEVQAQATKASERANAIRVMNFLLGASHATHPVACAQVQALVALPSRA